MAASRQNPEYSNSDIQRIANELALKLKLENCDPKQLSHLILNDTYEQAVNLFHLKNSPPQQIIYQSQHSHSADSPSASRQNLENERKEYLEARKAVKLEKADLSDGVLHDYNKNRNGHNRQSTRLGRKRDKLFPLDKVPGASSSR